MVMRLLRRTAGAWLCAMACLGTMPLLGAELNVNLEVLFKEDAWKTASTGTLAQEKRATIFVIDRSGSMNERDQPDGRTRWEALLEGVKADLDTLPDGEAVSLVIFQTVVMPVQTFSGSLFKQGTEYRLLDGRGAREEVLKRIAENAPEKSRSNGTWIGATALYDALGVTSELVKRLGDGGFSSVQILIHSDGQDTASKRFKGFDDVKAKYGIDWEQFKALKIVGRWWGANTALPPDMYSVFANKPGSIRLTLLSKDQLQNPAVAEKQSVDLQAVVEAPRDLWGEVQGKDAMLTLQLDGYDSVYATFPLTNGKYTCLLALPGNLPRDQEKSGKLKVGGLPESKKLVLSDPNAVSIVFAKPGAVSMNVLKPRSNLCVLKGDVVDFLVEGTPGAAFKWQFNGADGGSVPMFSRKLDGTVAYAVTGTKPGLIECRSTGKVEVVDADIQIAKPARNPRVGESTEFKAVTRGTADAIQWFVDGRAVQEIVFKKDGPHTVMAQAQVQRVRPISAEIQVQVDPAPIIEINELDDSVFPARSNIAFRARVAGFSEITWICTGPEMKTETTRVKENAASVQLAFAKGGRYTISASGVVDGKTMASNTRTFDVRPEEIWVKILEPLGHEFVVDKAEGNACAFVAQVKGEDIAKIRWSVKNAETGEPVFEDDVRDVDGDKSSATWIFTPAHAGSVNVMAAAVFKGRGDPDGVLVTGNRTIWVRPVGSVAIQSPAKNTLLPFGATQIFDASVKGAVDPKAVAWYQRDKDGKWQPLPNAVGVRYSHTFGHTGRTNDFADFRVAAAGNPESPWRDEIRIRLECPPISPHIVLPTTNGVVRTEFGLREKITLGLIANGDVSRVDWDFGDGSRTNAAAGVAHSFARYGSVTIKATAHCSRCPDVETAYAEVKVVKTPIKALFAILPEKETFTVNGKLTLVDESEGDIESIIWITNGQEIVGRPGDTLEISLPDRPALLTFCVRAVGYDKELSEYKRTVRVRYGWWAVVPILLAAAVVWWLLFRLLTGNAPRGWTIYAWDGPVPKLLHGGYPEERNYAGKGVPSPVKSHWNWITKKASIPLVELLGLSQDDGTLESGWGLVSREERFSFSLEGGRPFVERPTIVNDVSGMVADRDEAHYSLYQDGGGTIGAGKEFIRVVVEESPSGWVCPCLLILFTFAIIATVFWLCLKFAV